MQFSGDLGAGNDTFFLASVRYTGTLTLGSGQDRVELGSNFTLFSFNSFALTDPVALTITDFTPGAGGDVLDLARLVWPLDTWDWISNPFATGHLRLIASGADTFVAGSAIFGSADYAKTIRVMRKAIDAAV